MIKRGFKSRALLALGAIASALAVGVPLAQAGGPLLVVDRQPVRWSRSEVVNPANSNLKTVDAAGRILYRVDSGKLGPLSNAEAVKLVDRIFKLYTDIPTADIDFVKAGSIIDPATNSPVDVNGSNFGRYANPSSPTFQNPIIFDSDGSITGEGGVLGFFGFLQFDESSNSLAEGMVVLNGGALARGSISTTSFLGVFTHEFGHFAGPLDHAQINGNIASLGLGSTMPSGFSAAQTYDLYAPFTETMYPFIFDWQHADTALSTRFGDSGYFIASLDMDTKNALSNLYPSADYHATHGSIEGRVLLRTSEGDIPLTGVNVIARRIDQGAYPPAPGTSAFVSSPIAVDGDGVPLIPPTQGATDSLATVSSAVTGLEFGAGAYRIQGLPEGQYLVEIQQINPRALGGSGIGPLGTQLSLPVEEYYSGGRESNDSNDSPRDYAPVFVTAGGTASGIDIILNGMNSAAPTPFGEAEPNELAKKAQNIPSSPAQITAGASSFDASKLKMRLGSETDGIEDLYSFTVPSHGTYFVILEPISGSGDLDLYLFRSTVNKKKTNLDDPNLLGYSASGSSNELVALTLAPDKYVIGVSSYDGSVRYRLRVIPSL
ncbi:MAG TPA: pre-peptidase C-terminal domain-containing protein [Blastocatellia bacterium]|nr:pre-peptidase C-terminal domain-containing protein [Blastocatellia bacterium]